MRRVRDGWPRAGLSGAMLAAACLGAACGSSEPARRPNVLVVLVDALRGDALSVNGYGLPTTPYLDAMVRDGAVNFRRAYAHSTWTKPSIASLFTSLHPAEHGIHLVASPGEGDQLLAQSLDGSFTTLAEAFRSAGYQTGAVINQVHLSRSGFDQGFDEFVSMRGKGAGRLNRRLLRWLDGLDREKPFFAYLHYLDVHWPYNNRSGRGQIFGPTELDPEPPTRGNRATEWAADFDEESLAPLRARYDHEVAFIDRRIASLAAALEERGLAEETLLVVTSDHGEGFLEHGRIQHGYAPYAEVTHVPLILRLPAWLEVAERDIDTPVGIVDVMPTLLELAGIEPPEGLQGKSLVRLMRGRSPRRVTVFANGEEAVAVRGPGHAVLRFDDRLERFDAAADPGERRPLATCPAECRRLVEQADLYARLLAASDPARAVLQLTDEELEELRQLGYL